MAHRIVTAREQYELLVPWLIEAAPRRLEGPQRPGRPALGVDPDLWGPSDYEHQGDQNQPVPRQPAPNIGADTTWSRVNWHEAVKRDPHTGDIGEYGHFTSTSRPPSSGDTPHPLDLLKEMKPHIANNPNRTLEIEEEDGTKRKVSRPSWREMIEGAKEPLLDPAGILPPNEYVRDHVDNMKERIRRGRGYGSPPNSPYSPPPLNGPNGREKREPEPVPDNPDFFRDQVNHLKDRLQNGQDEDNGGLFWYSAAHDRSKNIAEKTHGDQDRVIGTDSALSPLKDWDVNTEQSAHFNTHYPWGLGGVGPMDGGINEQQRGDPNWRVPAPNPQNDKSRRVLDAPPGTTPEDIVDILQGPKTSSFMNNIRDKNLLKEPRSMAKAHEDFVAQHGGKMTSDEDSPYWHGNDPTVAKSKAPYDEGFYPHKINPHTGQPDFRYGDQDTTADTHHVRAHSIHPDADLSTVSYGTPDWFSEKATVNGKTHHLGYELSQRINQIANAELNAEEADAHRHTLPKQGQATGWVQWKQGLNAAGKSANLPEPGTAPKGYDPGRKNWGLGPLNKGTEEVLVKDPKFPRRKPKLVKRPLPDPNPAPREQFDVGDPWQDPRRPPSGPAFQGQDWDFEPSEDPDTKGRWIPPERATTTYTNEPRRGDPQSITHENYDPRMAPGWGRRPKDEDEWKWRDYNQYATEMWGDPGERGRWASVADSHDVDDWMTWL